MDELPGGPLLAERLDKAVREVCPIHGVSIGRRVDETGAWARDAWRVNPKPEATIDEIKAAYDVLASFDPNAEATPAPEPEPHNFPANMSDKLVDWVEPASEDLQQLMAGEETLAAAVERMTPGLDELLDMASALSEPSFEQAIVTIPVEKRNTWTERLFDERARLRLKRNTDEENLDRENLISRVATVFTKVGSKR